MPSLTKVPMLQRFASPKRPLPTLLGTINFRKGKLIRYPAATAWKRLQELHYRSLGKTGTYTLRFIQYHKPSYAKAKFENSVTAILGLIAVVDQPMVNQLFNSLLDFIKTEKSLDGLESIFLSGLNAVSSYSKDTYNEGVLVWQQYGGIDTLGGGASAAPVFDKSNDSVGILSLDQVNDLGSSLALDFSTGTETSLGGISIPGMDGDGELGGSFLGGISSGGFIPQGGSGAEAMSEETCKTVCAVGGAIIGGLIGVLSRDPEAVPTGVEGGGHLGEMLGDLICADTEIISLDPGRTGPDSSDAGTDDSTVTDTAPGTDTTSTNSGSTTTEVWSGGYTPTGGTSSDGTTTSSGGTSSEEPNYTPVEGGGSTGGGGGTGDGGGTEGGDGDEGSEEGSSEGMADPESGDDEPGVAPFGGKFMQAGYSFASGIGMRSLVSKLSNGTVGCHGLPRIQSDGKISLGFMSLALGTDGPSDSGGRGNGKLTGVHRSRVSSDLILAALGGNPLDKVINNTPVDKNTLIAHISQLGKNATLGDVLNLISSLNVANRFVTNGKINNKSNNRK